MTWVKGQSTWATIVDDMCKLACGEMADDTATTVVSGDRWVRDISSSYNLLRTPASQDVNTGTVHNRAGYFTLMSMGLTTANPDTYAFHKSVCKQTAVWSGVPTGLTNGSSGRWMMCIHVTTANTTPHDYSTLKYGYTLVDLDQPLSTSSASENSTMSVTNATTVGPGNSGNATPTILTKTIGLNFSDPTGIVKIGTRWMRGFTPTYLGGIDFFGPYWCRRSGNATFTVNPTGTSGTDFDLNVEVGTQWHTSLPTGTIAPLFNGSTPWGGPLGGVGIKTNTGLSGNQYACSWNMALMKIRPFAESGTLNGFINLDSYGGGVIDGGVYRRLAGFSMSGSNLPWLRPYVTPGQVTNASLIQYWMSVKADKIIIVLNADPGQTGTLTTAGVYKITSFNRDGYDKFPIVHSYNSQSAIAGFSLQYCQMFWTQLKLRQDGSEGRDWQDGWMRSDLCFNIRSDGANVADQFGWTNGVGGQWGAGAPQTQELAGLNTTTVSQNFTAEVPWASTKPNPYTGKWAMYGWSIIEAYGGTNPGSANRLYPRGYHKADLNAPFLWVPGGQWSSGDELTDAVSGAKYFLVSPVYAGLGVFATPAIGGFAILEN